MANQAITIGALSGMAGMTAGLLLQMIPSAMTQNVGHATMLGGLAATCVAGGFGLAPQTWRQYRREVHVFANLREFEMDVGQGLNTNAQYMDMYLSLAARAAVVFQDVSDEDKLKNLTFRMQKVGYEMARQMPSMDHAQAAYHAATATVGKLRSDIGYTGAFAPSSLPPFPFVRNEPMDSDESMHS